METVERPIIATRCEPELARRFAELARLNERSVSGELRLAIVERLARVEERSQERE
jgi:hypothetical protein